MGVDSRQSFVIIHLNKNEQAVSVVHALIGVSESNGVPKYIRLDNGREFTVKSVGNWLPRVGVITLLGQPISP